ncbi:hypothetical protein [Arthrobacter sp. Leaf234]|nr:hypothetical protein [Arthrobacter sp. Leaf234]
MTSWQARSPLQWSLLLRPEDVATAVRFIIDSPSNVCPTEIVLHPATRHA